MDAIHTILQPFCNSINCSFCTNKNHSILNCEKAKQEGETLHYEMIFAVFKKYKDTITMDWKKCYISDDIQMYIERYLLHTNNKFIPLFIIIHKDFI
jgi:hypothetical protein